MLGIGKGQSATPPCWFYPQSPGCWKLNECLLCFLLGSQERQDKLREMGFVDILHKLSQASDTNLSDRWATAAYYKARTLVELDTLRVRACLCVCVCGAGRAKTAMQQYLAWPWRRRKFIWRTWLVLLFLNFVLLYKGTICGPAVGHPSPPPPPT